MAEAYKILRGKSIKIFQAARKMRRNPHLKPFSGKFNLKKSGPKPIFYIVLSQNPAWGKTIQAHSTFIRMLRIKAFTCNPFQENTYILSNEAGHCVLVDPGCHSAGEKAAVKAYIQEQKLEPIAVWLTHCHVDHVLGLSWCCEQEWDIPYFLSRGEGPQLKAVEVYGPSFGIYDFQPVAKEGIWLDGPDLFLGDEHFRILRVPGHSPDHLAFYHYETDTLLSGDVLFQGSIGRTDLPGGDFAVLERSIQEQIYTLPAKTRVFPGHGPSTTVGSEMRSNPFVRALA